MSAPPQPQRRARAVAVTLRPAGAQDCQRIWKWRNDPVTRAVSFDSAEIPWDLHERWFSESLHRSDRKIYIIGVQDLSEGGVARLDIVGSEAAVSIHLAPEFRGQGVGPIVLRRLAVIALRELKLHRLIASVKNDNLASLSAFRKARFVETKRDGGVVTLERRRR